MEEILITKSRLIRLLDTTRTEYRGWCRHVWWSCHQVGQVDFLRVLWLIKTFLITLVTLAERKRMYC